MTTNVESTLVDMAFDMAHHATCNRRLSWKLYCCWLDSYLEMVFK